MKIHFLLLALVAFVALSQHYVDARLHDQAIRRMTEHRLLDELLHRRMEALEEMEGEQDSLQDGFVESRRLREGRSCNRKLPCPTTYGRTAWKFICINGRCKKTCDAQCLRSCRGKCNWAKCTNKKKICTRKDIRGKCTGWKEVCDDKFNECMRGCIA